MNRKEKLKFVENFLVEYGLPADEAIELAAESVEEGQPIVETICFQMVAESVLACIHTSGWIRARSKSDGPEGELLKRLLHSGAAPKDLAIFARMMQREYLSNLGCVLDGAGLSGTPEVPCDFRIYTIDENGSPLIALDELHESLGWSDLKTEMKLSRLKT